MVRNFVANVVAVENNKIKPGHFIISSKDTKNI